MDEDRPGPRRAGRKRVARRAAWALLVAGGACWALSGEIDPPVVLDSLRRGIDTSLFPPGTELLALTADDGTILRGVAVPALRPGPVPLVVLNLLESGSTVAIGARPASRTRESEPTWKPGEAPVPDLVSEGLLSIAVPGPREPPAELPADHAVLEHAALAQLSWLGAQVVSVDYTGVGASDGERSSDWIRRDARLAWEEALRRAGGDEKRVVIRASSLGTLAAASLLQEGLRPAALVLVAPVRDETVVRNAGSLLVSPWLAALTSWIFRPPVGVDLALEIRRSGVPTLVVLPAADDFLGLHEGEMLRDAVSQGIGACVTRGRSHIMLALRGRSLLPVEAWFLARLGLVASAGQRTLDEVQAWSERLARVPEAQDGWPDGPPPPPHFEPGSEERARLYRLARLHGSPHPGLLAAVALHSMDEDEQEALIHVLGWLPGDRVQELDAVDMALLATIEDFGLDERGEAGDLVVAAGLATELSAAAWASEDPLEYVVDAVRRDVFERDPEDHVAPETLGLARLDVGYFESQASPREILMANLREAWLHSGQQTSFDRVVSHAEASQGPDSEAARKVRGLQRSLLATRVMWRVLKVCGIPVLIDGSKDGAMGVRARLGGVWRVVPLPQ